MPRLLVCLPCYNEAQALPQLLSRLSALAPSLAPEWSLEALVVDDGSTDGTGALATASAGLPVTLLTHARNAGLGSAVADGLAWFLEHRGEADLLALLDADLTHPPELLPEMIAKLSKDRADVVIASRYAPGGAEHGLSKRRRVLSRLASIALSLLAPMADVLDYTCGYRLYSGGILKRANARFGAALIEERGFVCMAELLIKLRTCNARAAEVGLDLHYELKPGLSKMNVPATIRRYSALGWRILTDANLRSARGG